MREARTRCAHHRRLRMLANGCRVAGYRCRRRTAAEPGTAGATQRSPKGAAETENAAAAAAGGKDAAATGSAPEVPRAIEALNAAQVQAAGLAVLTQPTSKYLVSSQRARPTQ